jgi:hypothetical protein
VKIRLLQRLLGAYCPDEWVVREARTAKAVAQAKVTAAKSDRIMGMVKSYATLDERMSR